MILLMDYPLKRYILNRMNAVKPSRPELHRTLHRKRNWLVAVVVVLLVAGVSFRLALPAVLTWYVNRVLQTIPGYRGTVADIDVALIRGAYVIHGLKLDKIKAKVPVPFFSSATTDLSVDWRSLLEGKLVSEISLDRAQLNFVDGATEDQRQTAITDEWLEAVKKLFPLRINRFQVTQSEIHYRNFASDPRIDIAIEGVKLSGSNFSNTRTPSEEPAVIQGSGMIEREAKITLSSAIWTSAKKPTFNAKIGTENLSVVRLNDFLRAYAHFDAEKGTISVFTEMTARDGKLEGYIKPIVQNLSVIRWRDDAQNPITFIWENLMGAVAQLFTNVRKDQLATEIRFTGTLESQNTDVWGAVTGIIQNAFVEAMKKGFVSDSDK